MMTPPRVQHLPQPLAFANIIFDGMEADLVRSGRSLAPGPFLRRMDMHEELQLDISFTDESTEEVVALLRAVGAKDVRQLKQRGFTGIEIVVIGTLLAQALANLVLKLSPLWKCGLIVDARQSHIQTQKDCNLPRGTVLVISPDGTESQLHEPSEQEVTSLIGTALAAKP